MRFDYALFALIAPLAVLGDLRHSGRRSHHDIAKRAEASVQLHKREVFSSARWTFYDVGGAPGACGAFNTPDQHIVALNSAQYGGGSPGPMCGKTIIMTLNGKQTTATIADECPGCPFGGLDLTRGLFQFFGPLSLGVITGEWYFADDAPAPAPSPPPEPKPTTTPKPPPPPPSTTHHTTTSTTHTTPKTTSTEQWSSSSSSPSSSHSSSSSASSLKVSSVASSIVASPTGVVSAGDGPGQNIAGCNQVLLNMGNLIVAGTQF